MNIRKSGIKVLHIIDSLGLGGAQTIVKGIVEQSQISNDHFVFALRARDITMDIDNPNVAIFPSSKKYSFAPLHTLKTYIEQNDITILHCHLFRSVVFGYILKRLYFPRLTLIVHEHGHIFREDKIYPFLLKKFTPFINQYIGISRATSDYLQSKAGVSPSKIHLLYNFVDLERFSARQSDTKLESRKRHSIPKDAFVFGFAGRLIKRKGWREFVQAAIFLSEDVSDVHFLIAGAGDDEADLKMLIADTPSIHYLGYQPDMPAFYQMLDCFVVPSHWEPMGLTEIEAQAMNIPVISSNVPALNEIIYHKENGLLFEAKNVPDLLRVMGIVLSDSSLRKSITDRGYQSAQKYSLETYLSALNTIYKK